MAKKTQTDRESQKTHWISNPLRKRLYTIKEAAQYLGRKEYGVRDLIWKQCLPVVKEGNGTKIYIDIEDLDNYIRHNKTYYS